MSLIDSKLSYVVWPPHRAGPIPEPSIGGGARRRGVSERDEKADNDRERSQKSRVTVGKAFSFGDR